MLKIFFYLITCMHIFDGQLAERYVAKIQFQWYSGVLFKHPDNPLVHHHNLHCWWYCNVLCLYDILMITAIDSGRKCVFPFPDITSSFPKRMWWPSLALVLCQEHVKNYYQHKLFVAEKKSPYWLVVVQGMVNTMDLDFFLFFSWMDRPPPLTG